jgi:hypothetical protein
MRESQSVAEPTSAAGAPAVGSLVVVARSPSDVGGPSLEGCRERFRISVWYGWGWPENSQVFDRPNLHEARSSAPCRPPIPDVNERPKGTTQDGNVEFPYDESSGLYVGRTEVVREPLFDIFFGADM